MDKCVSLKRAEKVYKELEKILLAKKIINPKVKDDGLLLKSWANGREQGYFLLIAPAGILPDEWSGVCFAENRNSDQMVVITGLLYEFDGQTNHPSEGIWVVNREYFKTEKLAAHYIAGYISEVLGYSLQKKKSKK
jgi:hypothetical protein